jgi:hypothetical protein
MRRWYRRFRTIGDRNRLLSCLLPRSRVASTEVVYGGPDVGRVVNVETVTA